MCLLNLHQLTTRGPHNPQGDVPGALGWLFETARLGCYVAALGLV